MPMQISVRVTDNGITQGIRKVADGYVEATREEMDEITEDMQYEASGGYSGGSSYDLVPERGYQRTGNYGRSFVREKAGLTYRLTNATYTPTGHEYGGYVGGNSEGQGQAWMHQGVWPTIRGAVDKIVNSELVARIERKLADFFQRMGVGM